MLKSDKSMAEKIFGSSKFIADRTDKQFCDCLSDFIIYGCFCDKRFHVMRLNCV